MTKRYDLEILVTTRKFFACEAETTQQAVEIAVSEARKHLGEDFYAFEIRDPSAGWPQQLHKVEKNDII
jgi:hypothetical protein